MNRMDQCTGTLLTGGGGKRFGADKMPVALGGRPLASYGLDFLRLHFSKVIVCGRYSPDPIVSLYDDRLQNGGPLAGIETALRVSETAWVFALAGDMPFPHRAVVDRLWERAAGEDSLAIVPQWKQGLEPLFAFYHRDCLTVIEGLLNVGERSIRRLFGLVPTTPVNLENDPEVAPVLSRCFRNINFPEDLDSLMG